MNGVSRNTRALFDVAREDGPGARERDALWERIAVASGVSAVSVGAATASAAAAASAANSVMASGGTGAAAAAAASVVKHGPSAAKATSQVASVMKVLVLGGVIGAVSTALGVIVATTFLQPAPPAARLAAMRQVSHDDALAVPLVTSAARRKTATGKESGESANESANETGRPSVADPGMAASANAGADAHATNAVAKANATATAKTASSKREADSNAASGSDAADALPASELAEEARLVTNARAALVQGAPDRALALVQATRHLAARSLEPEELGLEVRALRALGRVDEAAATELVLRRRYPEHALAR